MHQLMQATSPGCRHDGQPWTPWDKSSRMPAGKRIPPAGLIQGRGDWDWYTSGFRFRSAGAEFFCWKCQTTKHGINSYMQFDPAAPHRGTLIDHVAYVNECRRLGQPLPAIFFCPGFHIGLISIDTMHTGDLGIFADIAGSLMWMEVTCKLYHRNRKMGLAQLNGDLAKYFRTVETANVTKTVGLTYSQLRSEQPGYPFLKCKAAQVRCLAPFLLLLARRHLYGDGTRPAFAFKPSFRLAARSHEHSRLVVTCCEGVLDYHQSCKIEPFDPVACKRAVYQVLTSLKALHDMWRVGVPDEDHGPLPWHCRPKAHLMQHLAEDQLELFGTPSLSHCYGDEDFCGCIKRVAVRTKHPWTLEKRVSEKCRILAGVDAYYLEYPELQAVPVDL